MSRTSTEVADVLPALARRAHGEHNALRERIQGIQQLQLRITTCEGLMGEVKEGRNVKMSSGKDKRKV